MALSAAGTKQDNWSSQNYALHGGFNHHVAGPAFALLNAQPGERVLDLGCGDGVNTQKLVDLGCSVVGVDGSPNLVAAAQKLGLDARVMDGQQLEFDREFDAVFSHAALHWMKDDPDAVIKGVGRALRPGGRFVSDSGGQGNVLSVRVALSAVLAHHGIDAFTLDPWYFPSDEQYKRKLEAHGFVVDSIALVHRPTALPTDMGGWLDTFAVSYLKDLPQELQEQVRAETVAALETNLTCDDGVQRVDYVRLRFQAHLPSTA